MTSDPEGTITSARTLMEAVCKSILNDKGIEHTDVGDLKRLYKATAKSINMSGDPKLSATVNQFISGASSIVAGLAGLRNNFSDAHGAGPNNIRPAERHAELAVNMSGALCHFLLRSSKEVKTTGQEIENQM